MQQLQTNGFRSIPVRHVEVVAFVPEALCERFIEPNVIAKYLLEDPVGDAALPPCVEAFPWLNRPLREFERTFREEAPRALNKTFDTAYAQNRVLLPKPASEEVVGDYREQLGA